jgi:hypothetical protein
VAPGGGVAGGPSPGGRVFAFDYDHSGKMDYLVIYCPGAGYVSILRNAGGVLAPVYSGRGIGGYDLMSPSDQGFAFDYDHSGKLDHLFFYRPGTGLVTILQRAGEDFTPVYSGSGVGGYAPESWRDRAFAYDYDQSGKLDHLVFYRPGMGTVAITYFPARP